MMLLGSIVNAGAILAGSGAGLLLKWSAAQVSSRSGGELGERLRTIVMQGLALCTTCMGISGALKGRNSLITILSIVLGALIGETLDLDGALKRGGDWIQRKMERFSASGASTVSEAFVTASLLYCVGAMSIVGALNSGLSGDHSMLFAKSLLDGVSSVVFAASLGFGVALSAVTALVYQGAITVAASFLAPYLGEAVVAEMTCAGSLMIVAISFNMLGLTKIRVMNLVPGLFLPILLCRFF